MTKQPSYRFEGYTESWVEKKLGEVGEIQTGNTPPTNEEDNYEKNGFPWVTPTDINSLVLHTTSKQLSEVGKSKARIAKSGSILVTCIASIGKNTLVRTDSAFNQQINSLTPSEKYSSYFLLTQSEMWSRYMLSVAGAGTMQIINKSDFSNMKTIVPSLLEQTTIGSFFQDIDQLISLQQRKLEVLKEQKKTYLKLLFPAKGQTKPALRFAGFEDEWKEVKLGEIGVTKSGVGFPDSEQGGVKGIPFYKVSDMNNIGNEIEMVTSNNYVTQEQIDSRKWKVIDTVPAIMFAKVGAALLLNRKRLIREPFLIDNNTMVYIPSVYWDVMFCKILFDTLNLSKYSQVGALPSYNGSDIEAIQVSIPSLPEQEAIGSFFQDLDKSIAKQEEKVNQLKESKQTLLRKMFI